jgi:hypothetical protein
MANKIPDLGLLIRKEVLVSSLMIEGLTSAFLSTLLGIKDYTNSKTLGNKGGSLSFNQKIDLLIEIGALSKNNRNKYQAFMEIRNQFIHNISASTYEKCLAATNGTDKFLLKTYPQDSKLSREKQLEEASRQLSNELGQLTVSLTERIKENARKDVEVLITKRSQQALIDSIEQMKTALDDYFDKEITKSTTFNTVRLKGLGTGVSKILYGLWNKNFDKLNSINDSDESNRVTEIKSME